MPEGTDRARPANDELVSFLRWLAGENYITDTHVGDGYLESIVDEYAASTAAAHVG